MSESIIELNNYAEEHNRPLLPLPPAAFERTTPDPVPTVTAVPEFVEPIRDELYVSTSNSDEAIVDQPERKRIGRPLKDRSNDPVKRPYVRKKPYVKPVKSAEDVLAEVLPEDATKEELDADISKKTMYARRVANRTFIRALPMVAELLVEIAAGKKEVSKNQYDALKEIVAQTSGKPGQKAPVKDETKTPVLNFDMPFLKELEANAVDTAEPNEHEQ